MVKVLHLVAGGISSGAGRGAYWLHRAQRERGIESTILTNGRDDLGDDSVIALAKNPLARLKFALSSRVGRLPLKLYKNREQFTLNTGFTGVDFTKYPAYNSADIIHLHWINDLVAMHTLLKVNKPIVWTMRDMWPMTGGCHYSLDCERYKIGCGLCPQLGSQTKFDLTRLVAKLKKITIPKNIALVGISEWLTESSRKSWVLTGLESRTIGNNIDTNDFFPIPKKTARECLGLDTAKKIVLVGAFSVTDFYKGFGFFLDALKFVDSKNIHLCFFGGTPNKAFMGLGFDFTNFGLLTDTVALRLAYSAADVFVAPSRMDAFGKTIAEAMSCGTPVVCFDATGPRDIVQHLVTGYKAQPFQPKDLAAGITWILEQPLDKYLTICGDARRQIQINFDSSVIAERYHNMYKELLER